ncbi:MAG: TraR/DksA C4-type zinc finger protein, partial [Ramlibacter sp.]|nr:TraR/DksA C4-type zinc finger protein [Cryobacterium sp.]
EFAEELAAIDAALQRLAGGTFGFCTRGGERIGDERLLARPAADLCIDCARAAETRRR